MSERNLFDLTGKVCDRHRRRARARQGDRARPRRRGRRRGRRESQARQLREPPREIEALGGARWRSAVTRPADQIDALVASAYDAFGASTSS
jgi:hypothetical protein